MQSDVKERITDQIKSQRIMLFMKGTPAFPQCGFSNQVVQILRFRLLGHIRTSPNTIGRVIP